MIFVCNTGPLIALAKLARLSFLQDLEGERVLIPPMVHKELWGKIGPEAPLIEAALHSFISVAQPGTTGQHVEMAIARLDDGEKEVIGLGTSLQEEVVLLMDDQVGRRVAKALGLSVVGMGPIAVRSTQFGGGISRITAFPHLSLQFESFL